MGEVNTMEPQRESWGNKIQFLLSCMGFSIGLGNVWRFPFKAYENGGGTFLIPYAIMLIVAGIPLYYMELAIGQFSSLGPITVWNKLPLFRGIGYAMAMVSALVCVYYNVIIAWVIYYIFASIRTTLFWETCDNEWNTINCDIAYEKCRELGGLMENYNCTFKYKDWTPEQMENITITKVHWESPAEEFFSFKLLDESDSIEEMGELLWPQLSCLVLSWCLMFLCLVKGIKTSGVVVYIAVPVPFILLIIFLIRGVTLPGAWKGISFFISPQWERLQDAVVWSEAATQIFYSLGIGFGSLMSMSSYNQYNNNVYRDALIVSILNCCTSVFAGFAIFSFMGFMAESMGVEVKDVVESGTGLAFIAYPKAVTLMPISPLWSVLFFLMMLLLGLDSQFAMFETVSTAIVDEMPNLRPYKTIVLTVLVVIMFLLGLPMCFQGGIYVFTLFDTYSAGFSIILIGMLECIAIAWVYGFHNFSYDIKTMLGHRPGIWWYVCWLVISPAVLAFIAIYSLIQYKPAFRGDYQFPSWANGIGWMLTISSLIWIPVMGMVEFCRSRGSFRQRIRYITTPKQSWAPAAKVDRDNWLADKTNTGFTEMVRKYLKS